MSPQDRWKMQAAVLLQHIDRERMSIRTRVARLSGDSGDTGIPGEVFHRLNAGLKVQADKLQDLLRSLVAGASLASIHTTYREVEQDCSDLFGECLAVFTADAVRALKLDRGACSVLERLIRGIGQSVGVPWQHVTTLAHSEFFATASQVIRLRYPVSSIWDFPVAAHELGHFIGPRWPSSVGGVPTGYQAFLEVSALGSKSQLSEYFADMFATFTLGPSYVNTCLLRRFNPASERSSSHPADGERAEWILAALEFLLVDAEKERPRSSVTLLFLKSTLTERRADWSAAVEAAGGPRLDAQMVGRLRSQGRTLWRALKTWAGNVACLDLSDALKLHAAFLENPDPKSIQFKACIKDVLNAAWLLYMDHENEPQKILAIERWAETVCITAQA